MKKATSKTAKMVEPDCLADDDLRPEYDFDYSRARRNPYAKRLWNTKIVVVLDASPELDYPVQQAADSGLMDSPTDKEHQRLEWKESWRDEHLKSICGFANADGGMLVIGRSDDGKLVGVKKASKLLEDIPNKVRDIMGILVKVDLLCESDMEYIEITVDPHSYPISFKGDYYQRSGATNQVLKGAALDRFLLRRLGLNWDGVPVPYVKIKDLSAAAINRFRKQAANSQRIEPGVLRESRAALIEKLHLNDGDYLKRAAVLLFHPDPERYVTGAFVKIGFFRTNSDLLYQDEIHGDLFTQVDKTLDILLTKYLRAGISYRGIQRVETLPVPEPALREAILNAVIHKDYSTGVPTQISVYDDKLMIWNSGQLPADWTMEKLMGKHHSQPYNPDIADAFFRAGKIEAWGRGIERIYDACKTAGVPAPELRFESTGLWVEFPYPSFLGSPKTETPVETPVTTQETQKTPVESTETPVETTITTQETQKTPVETTETPVKTTVTTQETRKTTQETQKTPVETSITPVETTETPVKTSITPVETTETPVKTQGKIREYLRQNPEASLADVAEGIGKSLRAVERAVSKLVDNGALRFVGSRKSGRWEVLD